ncbi:MAG: hypothetical protein KDB00_01220 [Planctomycetales bacterium]|nr:hypothetical protein [Planctomycetales bacterium]
MTSVELKSENASITGLALGCRPIATSKTRLMYDGGGHVQAYRPKRDPLAAKPESSKRSMYQQRSSDVVDNKTAVADSIVSESGDSSEKRRLFLGLLSTAGTSELRHITVQISDGRIVLAGRVSCFYYKQLAQESVRPLAIGMQIVNEIDVS